MADLNDLHRQLQGMQKQVRFATARAITSTVRKIEAAEKENLRRKLDNPTPFTVNSVRSKGATRDNLTGRVFIMDTAVPYLEPFEVGGLHYLGEGQKAVLNPKNIRLNKYGNLPKAKLQQLKARPDVFIGKVMNNDGEAVGGVWQRKKAKKVAKTRKRRKRSPNGTRAPRKKNRPPKLLIRFGDALPVTPVLGYQELAHDMASRLMKTELNVALEQALKTAK
ncbi:TPA: hypothetical protein JWK76_002600 [Escherichia coli]|uniref:hypothetical protein n=2 Tax=Escherichia TaxID=561 RepID=UPI0002EE9F52|nr:hypothetical protein [Escherichia coli]EES3797924.1 hypothetical protein [Escherichia coli]EFC9844750.1 hypothetical protein [Escherichia coli]EFG2176059.1 hypothetical protein [Escherichia coli]EFJ5715407.1 hypothetical protein [Escherichia coli]EFK1933431.1 hypothetical protein [Escherichia coli]